MSLLLVLDHLGVFVFAISGALMAVRKNMDLFGMLVLALLPAIGGGTLRDLLLGLPIFWIEEPRYLLVTVIAATFTYFFQRFMRQGTRALAWADAMGLSVFCVLGAQKALSSGAGISVSIVMGVMTAVAGGIVRDVVANEVPYILKREIYATAALAGCGTYLLLVSLQPGWYATWLAMGVALAFRGMGIVRGWSLPSSKR